jgi:N-methylhydantoinase A
MIAFGGAGGLHAADLAREVGIRRVVIPRLPGLMSARGILYIHVRHDLLEPLFQRSRQLDPEVIRSAARRSLANCDELKSRDSGIREWRIEHQADLRYSGQISGYRTAPIPGDDVVDGIRQLIARFGDEHEREFGYQLPPEISDIEVVNLRTTLLGSVDEPPEPAYEAAAVAESPVGAPVYFIGEAKRIDTPYVERDSLAVGDRFEGPAVITEWDSTTVVPPRSLLSVAETGDLVIALPD